MCCLYEAELRWYRLNLSVFEDNLVITGSVVYVCIKQVLLLSKDLKFIR